MVDRAIPDAFTPFRKTPVFTKDSVPKALLSEHQSSTWAKLNVVAGTVIFNEPSNVQSENNFIVKVGAGDSCIIIPNVKHYVEPSIDAEFYIEFYSNPDISEQVENIEIGKRK